jgi:spore maturation protein CgeB
MHQERSINLGLVGQGNGSLVKFGKTRDDFIDYLKKSPYNLQQFLDNFGEDYATLQNKIKIMFDRTITHNIGTRIFESCAAGCVALWSPGYDNGIDELFTPNVHYIPYRTFEDLDVIIEDLLNNPSKVERITKAAEKHVLNSHTYAHRVWQILENIGLKTIKIIQ